VENKTTEEALEEVADLCEYWRNHRNKKYLSKTIRDAMLICFRQMQERADAEQRQQHDQKQS